MLYRRIFRTFSSIVRGFTCCPLSVVYPLILSCPASAVFVSSPFCKHARMHTDSLLVRTPYCALPSRTPVASFSKCPWTVTQEWTTETTRQGTRGMQRVQWEAFYGFPVASLPVSHRLFPFFMFSYEERTARTLRIARTASRPADSLANRRAGGWAILSGVGRCCACVVYFGVGGVGPLAWERTGELAKYLESIGASE